MILLTADDLAALDLDQSVLVESTGVGAMPDLSGDYDLVMQFEHLISSAEFIRQDIASQGGMSRSLAMEMYEVWPELAERRPLTFYTNQPSKTMLQLSLEEIHLGIAAGIAAAFAALIAAIWKLWKWIRGGKDSASDASSAASEDGSFIQKEGSENIKRTEEIKEVAQVIQAAPETVVQEATKVIEDKAEKEARSRHGVAEPHVSVVDNQNRLITSALKLISAEQHGLMEAFGSEEFHDILHQGEWTKASQAAIQAFKGRETDLRDRLKKIQSVIKHDPTQLSEEDIKSILHLSDEQEGRHGQDIDLEKAADEAQRRHHDLADKKTHETADLLDIGTKLGQISQSGLVKDLTATRIAILEVSSEFQSLENLLKPYADATVMKQVFGEEGSNRGLAHAMTRLRTEVMALNKLMGLYYTVSTRYINALKRYTKLYNTMVDRIGTITLNEFEHAGTRAEHAQDKEQAKGVVAKLRGLFRKGPAKVPGK